MNSSGWLSSFALSVRPSKRILSSASDALLRGEKGAGGAARRQQTARAPGLATARRREARKRRRRNAPPRAPPRDASVRHVAPGGRQGRQRGRRRAARGGRDQCPSRACGVQRRGGRIAHLTSSRRKISCGRVRRGRRRRGKGVRTSALRSGGNFTKGLPSAATPARARPGRRRQARTLLLRAERQASGRAARVSDAQGRDRRRLRPSPRAASRKPLQRPRGRRRRARHAPVEGVDNQRQHCEPRGDASGASAASARQSCDGTARFRGCCSGAGDYSRWLISAASARGDTPRQLAGSAGKRVQRARRQARRGTKPQHRRRHNCARNAAPDRCAARTLEGERLGTLGRHCDTMNGSGRADQGEKCTGSERFFFKTCLRSI
jgi:hypothetical protein